MAVGPAHGVAEEPPVPDPSGRRDPGDHLRHVGPALLPAGPRGARPLRGRACGSGRRSRSGPPRVQGSRDRGGRGRRVAAHELGGRIGRGLEPAIEPLGFDWKIGIGLLGAFAAREVFVSTMGVVYGIGADATEESPTLREKLRAERHRDGRAVYTPLVGLSLMVFFALACQCMSTLAAVRRETQSWAWTTFLFFYTGVLAWLASFAVYQGGRLLGLG
ncbi:MAG: hypothetical protein IPK67_14755 [Planctomycetes bacterium]|nr:hypothetical protein [Planctomycetota bacterium]